MHKLRIVQKLSLIPVEERMMVMNAAGNNTFLLKNEHIFLDMLTDSGVNAMSDNQLAAMMQSDDSYAGSKSFIKLEETSRRMFGKEYVLPVHQGRAAENILAKVFVKQGDIIPMNYHFTTTKAHILMNGGTVAELFMPEALKMSSTDLFKGNMDTEALKKLLEKEKGKIPFVRMEAGTNLIGGQPWSLANLRQVKDVCSEHNIPIVLDASLLADNLYFIKVREEKQKDSSIEEIIKQISDLCDIIYFSARKLGCARGGLMLTSNREY
jgi:tryptophanase